METNEKRSGFAGVLIGAVVLLCICLIVLGAGGYFFLRSQPSAVTLPVEFATLIPPVVEATEAPTPFTTEPVSVEPLDVLKNTAIPFADPYDLACRLNKVCDVPQVMATSAIPRATGDVGKFWTTNLDTNSNREVEATLRYITPHVYFWVENGLNVNETDIQALVETFETKIYPKNHEFFGQEWSPGIDGDEHIYILYAGSLGSSVGGYFSSGDERHPLVSEYSNGHEMFFFNSDKVQLRNSITYGVLAHEFQHMIHWNLDINESLWMNEGFSVLAMFLNGYPTGGYEQAYLADTDLQLNDWPYQESTIPHYGASYLYLKYFLDRFGEDATRMLVQEPANEFTAVENVLSQINATNPQTGQPITADAFFMDWAVTNFVLDPSVGDGRYVYKNSPDAQRTVVTEKISTCPKEPSLNTVHQYGVDYIAIDCAGDHTVRFAGSSSVKILPVDPYSGEYAFWSNKGDEGEMKLTREFDLTSVSGKVDLSYRAWFDIERDWDYVYVEASQDGQNWEILITPSGTGDDPIGNSLGWGYTGSSGDWVEETVDLSQYAGKKIFIRFEYVTDGAVNGEGFLVDDVSVEATGYRSDFEADDGGWIAEGFARIQNALPQTFGLSLLLSSDNSVTAIPFSADGTAEIPISLKPGETAYLIVSGMTRYTRQLASYQIEVK
ncbi:MAG TPA: immune inhibitor A [Anaerolineales bacterium]|nr:immune inhibitor A [Anaerolineales bacterium]